MTDDGDLTFMRRAARLAVRGHGGAAPNPLVGCVLVGTDGQVVGEGFHRRCGGPHAEIVALRQAGSQARGATAFVTLEPCNHVGRTGPCSVAMIDAGVRRVVIGRADPHPKAGGGAHRLAQAGVQIDWLHDQMVQRLVDPFVCRLRTERPWVTVKWAQTLDGRIATRGGESQWISGDRSRRLVHRERGRVDAILTGIGTALADDPRLTARGVRRRRVARRVVVDPDLRLPGDAALVSTIDQAPLTVACTARALEHHAEHANALARRGAELIPMACDDELPLGELLGELVRRHDTSHVLVEAGGGLVGRLFRDGLVNEAAVFVGPLLLGDEQAPAPAAGLCPPALADATRLELAHVHRRDPDVLLRYLVRKA